MITLDSHNRPRDHRTGASGWALGGLLVLGLLALFALPASAASAQQRTATVGTFRGPQAATLRQSAEEAIRENPRLTSSVPYDRSPEIVVSGQVMGRGRRQRFELRALDMYENVLATRSGRLVRGAAGQREVQSAMRSLLDSAIAALPPAEPAPSQAAAPPTEDETPTVADEAPEREPSASDPRLFTALAGVAIRNRTMNVSLANGGSHGYDSGAYAELGLALELRPLAHEADLARGLFARASYHHAVGLGSEQCDALGCTGYDTTFFRFAIDAGFLFDIERVAELGVSLGGGYEAYQLGANTVLPTADYPYLRVGVRARVRVLEELLVLDGDVGYRGLLGRDELGAAFGPTGDSFAIDASLGVSGALDFGMAYRVELGWAGAFHDFDGGGVIQRGTSGLDEGIRVGVMLGYGFP